MLLAKGLCSSETILRRYESEGFGSFLSCFRCPCITHWMSSSRDQVMSSPSLYLSIDNALYARVSRLMPFINIFFSIFNL